MNDGPSQFERSEADERVLHQLDALAAHDRGQPDEGFENRLAAALEEASTPRSLDRHRRRAMKRKSTAWIPFAAAAFVGVFAYMWMPEAPMTLPGADEGENVIAETPPAEDTFEADLLYASFEVMDAMLASADNVDDDLDWLELQLDAAEYTFSESAEWQEIGDAL